MSWHPNDLVSDVDLSDYEADILTNFGAANWLSRRTKALEDWLFPILKGRGFDPFRLITRAEPTLVYGFTASAYTDITAAAKDTTLDDINLAAIFATPGTDAIYLGSVQPFRGAFVREADTVGTAASVLTVAYWNGAWTAFTISDGTVKTAGKTFSGGGSITWTMPQDWQRRSVNSSDRLYWVKLTVTAVPTAAKAGQIATIRSSSLRAPATFRTLQLIFNEAPTGQEGPWREKALFYKEEADLALQRALLIVGGEFDSDTSDELSETEQQQTTDQVSNGPWALERA